MSSRWNFSSVDGRRITAARRVWRGLRKRDQSPNRSRSRTESLGARRRARFITRSYCFIDRLPATIAAAPPGPRSLAIVVGRWATSISRSFMAEQGRGVGHSGQDCPTCRSQAKIANSPYTGRRWHERRHSWLRSEQLFLWPDHGLCGTELGKLPLCRRTVWQCGCCMTRWP